MILLKRRALKFYNKFYERLDEMYPSTRNEKHIEISFRFFNSMRNSNDPNWVGDEPLQELYENEDLRKEVERLFVADGWKSLRVVRTPEKLSNINDAINRCIKEYFNPVYYLILDQ